MPDPFTPCPYRNRDDIPCWQVQGHASVCEVHPSDRGRTGQPVWSPEFSVAERSRDAVTEWREELGYDPITGEPC